MATPALTSLQQAVVDASRSVFVIGPAGTGKSTALQQRLLRLLHQREPAYTILLLVADRDQRLAYTRFVQEAAVGSYADLKIGHYSSLAREMVILFWPLVAREAGFRSGFQPPTFLGYDLAQLMMWRTVTPLLNQGAFAHVRLKPQRIVSQLLDTLSRAALNNLDMRQATERQVSAWVGEPDHRNSLEQAYEAAMLFRQHCQSHNLLDLSLTIDTFNRFVLGHPEFSRYFSERFRHLLVDNLEEQTPAGQLFISRLLPQTATTALAYDEGGGYRRFLSADPLGAARLSIACHQVIHLETSFSTTPALRAINQTIENFLNGQASWRDAEVEPTPLPILKKGQAAILRRINGRYRREMVFRLAQHLARLIGEEEVPPGEIAVIVPYMDGALQYSLMHAFKAEGIPMNLVRRRASPREEPRVRAWLTWTALAHPSWGVSPTEFDVAEALALSLPQFDPARAALLAQRLYDAGAGRLRPAEELAARYRERVGEEALAHYDLLRRWLQETPTIQPRLDHFLYQLFAELLSQPMLRPEPDLAGAAVCSWLVQTATRLCDSAESLGLLTPTEIGQAFLDSINQGLVTTQPPDTGDPPDPNGVIITSIYGFLLNAQPVRIQVWLETAASGWWDIPRQPLSNAFVLAPSWNSEQGWTASEEIDIRNQLLSRIIFGLTNRCREGVILATSELDRRGQRQDGPLWRALETARALSEASA